MELVVISHKECWADPASPSGYATVGGFPFQMQAVSACFDATTLLVPVRKTPLPEGARPLLGRNLRVHPLPEPAGLGWRRKGSMLGWLPRHLAALWRAVRAADAVHAPVPGDVGGIGLLVALAQRKPLFVRHCGTWGQPVTGADRALLWLLERIAGGRNVVMATGGADAPPSAHNPDVTWIFSTTLSEQEIERIEPAVPWQPGQPLRLATVGRLTADKNTVACVEALPLLAGRHPRVHLDVVGDGPCRADLEARAAALGRTDAVTFHDNVAHAEVLRILAGAHLFVFPTRTREGFPKAVLEAMACGLPVVATGVSVLPRLIGTANGRILGRTDAAALAEAVLALTSDARRLAAMAAGARAASRAYTLERWQAAIAQRLRERWGPLRQAEAPDEAPAPGVALTTPE